MSKWISVDDEMPAIGEHVILYSNGVVQHETHMLDASDDSDMYVSYYWVNNHVDCTEDSFKISDRDMWMPLPEPPK